MDDGEGETNLIRVLWKPREQYPSQKCNALLTLHRYVYPGRPVFSIP